MLSKLLLKSLRFGKMVGRYREKAGKRGEEPEQGKGKGGGIIYNNT